MCSKKVEEKIGFSKIGLMKKKEKKENQSKAKQR
jgi:hypothetical protein